MEKSCDFYTTKLPKVEDPRGNLTFVQTGLSCPFEIQRAYWIYDVPSGRERYGRALRRSWEMISALSGSFDVLLLNGDGHRQRIHLNRPDKAVVVPPMTWRTLDNFSTNSIALVTASEPYDPEEYVYDLDLVYTPYPKEK